MKKVVYRREKTHDDSGKLKEPKAGTPAKVVLYCIVVTAVLYVLLIFIENRLSMLMTGEGCTLLSKKFRPILK